MFGFRESGAGDTAILKTLWMASFEDTEEYIEDFLSLVPYRGFILELNGRAVSSAFVINGFEFIAPDGESMPAAYIYAVSTLPEFRSRGLGHELMRRLVDKMKDSHYFSALYPADDGLRSWYEKMYPLHQDFAMEVLEISSLPDTDLIAERISACEYSLLRERLLRGRAHMRMSDRLIGWQEHIGNKSGGGLFGIGGKLGCAACERSGTKLFIKELLWDGDIACAASACEKALKPRGLIEIRTPVLGIDGQWIKKSALSLLQNGCLTIKDAYWGFLFD